MLFPVTVRFPLQIIRLGLISAGLCLIFGGVSYASVEPATPSLSKLSIHLIGNYTPEAQQIMNAHPRVLKLLDTHHSMLVAAREFKQTTPNGVVVLRIYTPHRYHLTDDPVLSAQHFWSSILAPPINALSPSDRALIDYVEGPNEADSTPTWNTPEETVWYNTFWMTLAPLIANAGFRPCAYSISVGNPPGSLAQIQQTLDRMVPSLRLIKSLGGAWSYHPYTILYTTDPGIELWYSLRHRIYYQYFASTYPDLNNLPMIFTEGGVDGQYVPGGPGWKGGGDAQKFINWLTWWDAEIRKDTYVIGCTLFQSGSPWGWESFEIEPIADWLADHLMQHRANQTPQDAIHAADQSMVQIAGAVVSAEYPGYFYIQTEDRSAGIRVQKADHGLSRGMRVEVHGRVLTNTQGERFIAALEVYALGTGPAEPLNMTNRQVGGGPFAYDPVTGAGQRGMTGRAGLNNVGLLVMVWGRVTFVDPGGQYFIVWDGSDVTDSSGHPGIRVRVAGPLPGLSSLVAVTGVVSCYNFAGSLYPFILPRDGSDIRVLVP